MKFPLMKQISWYLVVIMFVFAIVPRVEAGFSSSEIIAMQNHDRSADLKKIQKVIETKMIRTRLEALGFSQEDIQKRLEQLSDEQAHQLALQIDDVKVGDGDALGVIIALLVIALLAVLLWQLMEHKVIITK